MPFSSVLRGLLESRGDVLIILDCCHAAAAFRGASEMTDGPLMSGAEFIVNREKTVELLAATGSEEYAHGGERSFTKFFDMAARHMAETGPFIMPHLVRTLLRTYLEISQTDCFALPAPSPAATPSPMSLVVNHRRPYHTIPNWITLVGCKPIIWEPV